MPFEVLLSSCAFSLSMTVLAFFLYFLLGTRAAVPKPLAAVWLVPPALGELVNNYMDSGYSYSASTLSGTPSSRFYLRISAVLGNVARLATNARFFSEMTLVLARVEGDIMLKDIYCPLTLNLGPDMEYELITRVPYSGSTSEAADTVGQYINQTQIGDRSYVYNDLDRGGSLAELGPLNLLEDINPQAAAVIYFRRSRSSTTTRSMAELEADLDCAKIPPLPPPSLVQDLEEE
ncbi:hypothetical protein B0H10DRAFT_2381116 [Mycena sp. CBHHK59/15]|nr:hypothetical protein B0H10DRAFT_2381116 [Mycena sp. CBHHK59/15]